MTKNNFFGLVKLMFVLILGYHLIGTALNFNPEAKVENPESVGTVLGLIFAVTISALLVIYQLPNAIRSLLNKPVKFKLLYWITSPPLLLLLIVFVVGLFTSELTFTSRIVPLAFVILSGLFFIITDFAKLNSSIINSK